MTELDRKQSQIDMAHKQLVNYENEHKSTVYPECVMLAAYVEPSWRHSWPSPRVPQQSHPHHLKSLKITLINMQEILITSVELKIFVIVRQKYTDLHTRHWLAHETIFRTERQEKYPLYLHTFVPSSYLMLHITVLSNGPLDVPCIEVVQILFLHSISKTWRRVTSLV